MYSQRNYNISHLSFNNDVTDEFCPVFYKNGLVFSSNNTESMPGSIMVDSDSLSTDMFYVERISETEYKEVDYFSKKLNTIYNDGPVSFNDDLSLVVYTRNIDMDYTKKEKKSQPLGKRSGLFFAEYSDGSWVNIYPFEFNDLGYPIAHPSLTGDGKRMYFVSNFPGGYGGTDIYYTDFLDGEWNFPVNAGELINTPQDELFPFIHPSGRLYFSSLGHNGMGGLDIFYSDKINSEWTKPFRLKDGINSVKDDFGYIIDKDFQVGYFNSNRKGSHDIYSFLSSFPRFSNCVESSSEDYCYTFSDNAITNNKNTFLVFEWNMGDGSIIRGKEIDYCFSDYGNYEITLSLLDTVLNRVYSTNTMNLSIKEKTDAYIESSDTIKLDRNSRFLGESINVVGKEDYYWCFGNDDMKKGKEVNYIFRNTGEYMIKLNVPIGVIDESTLNYKCVYKNVFVKDKSK